jgi:hypothetical protein
LPNSDAIAQTLQTALNLGGIREFKNLRYRKAKGQTVFGQVPSYPRASANDTEALIKEVSDRLTTLPEIYIPAGEPMNTGPGWTAIETDAAEVTIAETYYVPPMDVQQDLTQPPRVHD